MAPCPSPGARAYYERAIRENPAYRPAYDQWLPAALYGDARRRGAGLDPQLVLAGRAGGGGAGEHPGEAVRVPGVDLRGQSDELGARTGV